MDMINTFFVVNLTASIAVLIAFFAMRDSVNDGFAAVKTRISNGQWSGVAGAATSMVLLAGVANLFQ
jgi:uncharacterized membrane protein HdeD (DUF308 family)